MRAKHIYTIFTNSLLVFFIVTFFILGCPFTSFSKSKENLIIDNKFLYKHLPQIKNPRLMTEKDITREYERNTYLQEELSFVAIGDFNKDGNTDYVIVGKYDAHYNNMSMFVAIFSKSEQNVKLKYFDTFKNDRAFLFIEKGSKLKIKNISKKYDVIIVVLAVGSDNQFAIAWDGLKYIETTYDY